MAVQPILSLDAFRKLLDYDAEHGRFFWKPRTAEWFEGTKRSPESLALWFNRKYAGKKADSLCGHGYCVVYIRQQAVYSHQLVWFFETGEWPQETTDHINGNRADNRFTNLRQVSNRANSHNRALSRLNTTGIMGVGYDAKRDKWYAQIQGDKAIYLGRYATAAEAVAARRAAEKVLGFHPNHGQRHSEACLKPMK